MKFKIKSANALLISYFFCISVIGSFLLQIPGAYSAGVPVPYIDALFTSVSAVCVTGLSTVDMTVYTRLGFVLILLLIEAGGLGIIAFVSFFVAFPSKKVSLVNRRVIKDFL